MANISIDDLNLICAYAGTFDLHIKIYLIGLFATSIAICSIIFNGFLTVLFWFHPALKSSSLYYLSILAIFDIIMGVNYIALISLPVFMDFFDSLPLYHLFLAYVRPVIMESNVAIFASTLLIVVATFERSLSSLYSLKANAVRRWCECHRRLLSILCLLMAIAYKLTVYFEVAVKENVNCIGFARYELWPTDLSMNQAYSFWWMFVTRNVVDRLIPFFGLIFMNFMAIRGLKREHRRQSSMHVSHLSKKAVICSRSSLRDATRALISVVSMYLLSHSLMIIITIWETMARDHLEQELTTFYSYSNDVISIMTLLSSCLRLPVYCGFNRPIAKTTADTLRHLAEPCIGVVAKDWMVPSPNLVVSKDNSRIESTKKTSSSELFGRMVPMINDVISLESFNFERISSKAAEELLISDEKRGNCTEKQRLKIPEEMILLDIRENHVKFWHV